MSDYPLIKRCGLNIEIKECRTGADHASKVYYTVDVVKAEYVEKMLSKATSVYQGTGQAFTTDWCQTMPESNRRAEALLIGVQLVKPKEVVVTRASIAAAFDKTRVDDSMVDFLCAKLGL